MGHYKETGWEKISQKQIDEIVLLMRGCAICRMKDWDKKTQCYGVYMYDTIYHH